MNLDELSKIQLYSPSGGTVHMCVIVAQTFLIADRSI